jgi:preprotein translocase subunit SecE
VARNRKRAKDRRSRRPVDGALPEPGLATAGLEAGDHALGPSEPVDDAPDPLDQVDDAAGPVDHVGDGPGPVDQVDDAAGPVDHVGDGPGPVDHVGGTPDSLDHIDEAPDPLEHATPDVELAASQLAVGRPEVVEESEEDADEFEVEVEASIAAGGGAGNANGADIEEEGDTAHGELTRSGGAAPERRARSGFRLINFLQGSWRELQRVQWPDRRQVIQATGVVLGFVVVAGVYLGLADELSAKIVNFILK